MVVQFSRSNAINFHMLGLAPPGHNLVILLILGDGDICAHQVADGLVLFVNLVFSLDHLLLFEINGDG